MWEKAFTRGRMRVSGLGEEGRLGGSGGVPGQEPMVQGHSLRQGRRRRLKAVSGRSVAAGGGASRCPGPHPIPLAFSAGLAEDSLFQQRLSF